VTQDPFGNNPPVRFTKRLGTIPTYYELLDLPCSATADEVRRAYRSKSKLYHPDTTALPPEVAGQKFRELKDAYAVLNSPERRAAYDLGQQIGQQAELNSAQSRASGSQDTRFRASASAYLEPKERSLSAGEIFAVFLLGMTVLICLVLAIVLGIARGEMVIQTTAPTHLSLKSPSGKEQRIKLPPGTQRPNLKTADRKTKT
jgi:curved DNA-binding protein CbpA